MSLIPEGFDATDDMNHDRPENTPNWSESYAFWAFWDDHYLYLHFQRHPDDSGMWRGYASLQREDGSVIAAHTFGRELSRLGPGYQQCHAICEKPFEAYQVNVDAMGQISTWASLRERPIGSLDANITPLKADLRFLSDTPTYAPMPRDGKTHSNASWTHYTPCRVVGHVTVGGESRFIDAVGFRDHSAGVRSFDRMTSGYMCIGIFPSGKSFMAIGVGTMDDQGQNSSIGVGGVTIGGRLSYASAIQPPPNMISVPVPHKDLGTFSLETDQGTSAIRLKTMNQGVPLALLPPNFESFGLPDGLETRLYYHEWRLDLEWDGERGVGSLEPCIFIG